MRFTAVYVSYVFLGIGLLLPWNAFITAADYFELFYPGQHADRLFTICYLPVQLVTLFVMLYVHASLDTGKRILLGFCGFTAVMSIVPMLELSRFGHSSLQWILLLVATTGILDGIAQGALYGEVALLPPEYTQAVVAGTAVSGTAISGLRIICKAAFSHNAAKGLQVGIYVYFCLAAVVSLGCTLVYARVLPRQKGSMLATAAAEESQEPSSTISLNVGQASADFQEMQLSEQKSNISSEEVDVAETSTVLPETSLLDHPQDGAQDGHSLAFVAVHCSKPTASLVAIYTVTLAIFPGFLVEDISSPAFGSWYPVLLIAAFNLADLVGKMVPIVHLLAEKKSLLLGLSISRLLFVPLFWVAARQGAVPVAMLTFLLGLSNGSLTAWAMVVAPSGLASQDAQLAGNLSVFALISGLCLGALLSFFWLL